MKTITFYSYKGGVGRSLALLNIATRLAEFGKKVCVIDFDLEAPGLHLKFPLLKSELKKLDRGIVDYVYDFASKGIIPNDIKDFGIEVTASKNGKPICLIPAGNTESIEYWKKLSSINWYDLVYENPNGLAFFLKLKQTIDKNIQPDFLLIDSRTGISEMSGITLSLLADEVVMVAANNKENLDGISKIIKSITTPENNILGKIPKINFVLSRIPFTDKPEDRSKEILLINRIKREYLQPFPFINEVSLIHSDRELEEVEKVKIAYEKDDGNTQTSVDYLKLFERLTKNDLTIDEVNKFKNIRESERLLLQANNSGNIIQKLELISKAIELNRDNIDFYLYRSKIHADLEQYEDSMNDLELALAINELYLPAIYLKIEILIKQEKFSLADKAVNRLLSLRPYDINGLINKIIIYTNRGELNKAEDISTEIIDKHPEFSLGYSARGNIRRVKKDFENALVDVFKALELDSSNIQAITTLAEIYAETNRIDDFYIHLESALKMNSVYVEDAIKEEEIYKPFLNQERFQNLLTRYDILL
jgi:MinD-like ATPase involved in chromosome partitioning or flagellar assembly